MKFYKVNEIKNFKQTKEKKTWKLKRSLVFLTIFRKKKPYKKMNMSHVRMMNASAFNSHDFAPKLLHKNTKTQTMKRRRRRRKKTVFFLFLGMSCKQRIHWFYPVITISVYKKNFTDFIFGRTHNNYRTANTKRMNLQFIVEINATKIVSIVSFAFYFLSPFNSDWHKRREEHTKNTLMYIEGISSTATHNWITDRIFINTFWSNHVP